MKLSDAIHNQIDSNVRAKGKLYADWNMVKIISTSNSELLAEVNEENGIDHKVSIYIKPKQIVITCTCPYFKSQGTCKHIWAAIIIAEKNGFESKDVASDTVLIDNIDYDEYGDEIFGNEIQNKPLDKLREYLQQGNASPDKRSKQKNIYQFTKRGSALQKPPPDWKSLFTSITPSDSLQHSKNKSSGTGQIYYEIDGTSRVGLHDLKINFKIRKFKKDGEMGKESHFDINLQNINQITDQLDRQILSVILGPNTYNYISYKTTQLNQTLADLVLPMMVQTQRCRLVSKESTIDQLLLYDASRKWEFTLSLEECKDGYLVKPLFTCSNETRTLNDTIHINSAGYVFWNDGTVNTLEAHQLYSWIQNFIDETYIIPLNEAKIFVLNFKQLQDRPPFAYPQDLEIPEVCLDPVPALRIHENDDYRPTLILAELNFIYDHHVFKFGQKTRFIHDSNQNKLYRINHDFHNNCLEFLMELGVKEDIWNSYSSLLNFHKSRFYKIISTLLAHGWQVEGKNVQFKKPGNISFSVSSGIDWFEVQGTCEYEGETVSIPDILDAVKKKKDYIQLSNGGVGLLPTEWLEKYSRLASMGTTENDTIRFKKSQTLLIDLLLAEQPDINCDEVFKSIRNALHNFSGITPQKECGNFYGKLRNYQQEGLGWLSFLNQFGFGGCLADDMGLGKTIQVLAILEKQRFTAPESSKDTKNEEITESVKIPSLVIAPRSLIYNWYNEASRFTPDLNVLDFSHSQRTTDMAEFANYDLILVTYGTLRRDIKTLSNIRFNYVILDEAQMIKNASTVTAKAVRLLNGTNRLALSGTPVENHLSDLWSIFEFLNPEILGSVSLFKETTRSALPDENECELLRKALRPFILRRTKSQVALDLPTKTEELIICEMEPAQKNQYNQLKQFYQTSLKEKINQSGLNRSKIHILEALLRLRQAACHPGLIDKKHINAPSAKLDTLIANLQELKEEGHKSLVFSQFTSMLAIISDRLKKSDIKHEYLDGSSRKRQQIIDSFENDDDCSTFLISLKAGGVGLNLTAADYVFIFDPWWNPAAEMQAIDRTHRIGQTKPVFAYRLICKDTVEEKIIQLQKSKRSLAESLITTDESILSSITSEELELLLG